MFQNKHKLLWYAKRAGVAALALVLGALIFGGLAGPSVSAAPSKDKDEAFTRVYQHTYDEVFQGSLETIERLGMFVTAKDKDKGTIAGNGHSNATTPVTVYFEIHIEAVNATPETRVTINTTAKGAPPLCMGCKSGNMAQFKDHFSTELQKVLSTYH